MTPSDLLACAARIAPSGLARVRLLTDNAHGTLVGKRGPPVRRLAKDVELVEREAPPPPNLEAACVNCGAVARLKCTKCGASMCSRECALESWPVHKAACREEQAVRLGNEWARAGNRAVLFADAAFR